MLYPDEENFHVSGLHRPNLGTELEKLVGDPWVLRKVRVENHYARNDEDHVLVGIGKDFGSRISDFGIGKAANTEFRSSGVRIQNSGRPNADTPIGPQTPYPELRTPNPNPLRRTSRHR
jgi:hypothetical protein